MKYKITSILLLCAAVISGNAYAQKTLHGQSHYQYDGAKFNPTDSVKYFHSGTKGDLAPKYPIPEFEVMQDSAHFFTYSGSSWTMNARMVQTFSGTDIQQATYYKMSSGNWENDKRVTIVYKSGKPDTVLTESWSTFGSGSWRNSNRIMYSWSGNNYLTVYRQAFSGFGPNAKWTNDYMKTYTYNSSNLETSYINQDWQSGSWVNTEKIESTYSSNRVTKKERFVWSSGMWSINDRDNYSYDGSGRVTTKVSEYYVTTPSPKWINSYEYKYKYSGSSPNPDSMTKSGWDQGNSIFSPEKRYGYAFNSANKMTLEITESWTGTKFEYSAVNDTINNYYYNTASVGSLAGLDAELSVYPSPAQNTIHIAIEGAKTSEKWQFTITDMSGRIQKTWSELPVGVLSADVSTLPTGNYLLTVSDGSKAATKRFVVANK